MGNDQKGLYWATENVLDKNGNDNFGTLYAWGEITPTACYKDWSGYFDGASTAGFTNYIFNGGSTRLKPEHDVATQEWGGSWRMPTWDDWDLLISVSHFTLETTRPGAKVVAQNGGEIIFPFAGYKEDGYIKDRNLPQEGKYYGRYWSSDLYQDKEGVSGNKKDNSAFMLYMYFNTSTSPEDYIINKIDNFRYTGLPIRPVSDELTERTGIPVATG